MMNYNTTVSTSTKRPRIPPNTDAVYTIKLYGSDISSKTGQPFDYFEVEDDKGTIYTLYFKNRMSFGKDRGLEEEINFLMAAHGANKPTAAEQADWCKEKIQSAVGKQLRVVGVLAKKDGQPVLNKDGEPIANYRFYSVRT